MESAWRPFASPQHARGAASTPGAQATTPRPQNQAEAGPRPGNQSEISEPDSNLESPLSVEVSRPIPSSLAYVSPPNTLLQ